MNKVKAQFFISRRRIAVRRVINRRGQTLVEYALILAVISIVAIGVLINMGQQLRSVYSMIDSQVAQAGQSH